MNQIFVVHCYPNYKDVREVGILRFGGPRRYYYPSLERVAKIVDIVNDKVYHGQSLHQVLFVDGWTVYLKGKNNEN